MRDRFYRLLCRLGWHELTMDPETLLFEHRRPSGLGEALFTLVSVAVLGHPMWQWECKRCGRRIWS